VELSPGTYIKSWHNGSSTRCKHTLRKASSKIQSFCGTADLQMEERIFFSIILQSDKNVLELHAGIVKVFMQ